MRKLLIILEENAVGKQLQTLEDLTLSADDTAGVIAGDLDQEFVVFLFDPQVAFESEVVEHCEQCTVELLFLLIDFGVVFFRHFLLVPLVVQQRHLAATDTFPARC